MKWIFCLCLAVLCCANLEAKTKKAVYIIIDGVPADQVERVQPPTIYEIASQGKYERAYTGGEVGGYSETPTISAIGYTNLLTATWYNKHNVGGNENLKPNYNYWTIFRIAKEQKKDYKTGLYSSWIDNRTVLIGEGKPETNGLKIDYVKDGYDLDTVAYPHDKECYYVYNVDERVSKEAAESIRKDAPDISWVYLWYTDDAGHFYGNGAYFDEYLLKADNQVKRVWDAVKYREANFDEEWMVVVTTDHGRVESGYGHGGQSRRERTTWISTNVPVNEHFCAGQLSITDIAPSICRYVGFEVPRDIRWEQDGMPFIGKVDIYDLQTMPYDKTVTLSWKHYTPSVSVPVNVYVACSNNFKTGGKDEWIKLGTVTAGTGTYQVDLSKLPSSKFYKFVVESPNNHLNRWVK